MKILVTVLMLACSLSITPLNHAQNASPIPTAEPLPNAEENPGSWKGQIIGSVPLIGSLFELKSEFEQRENQSNSSTWPTDDNDSIPPLITDNSYWRLAERGEALIIPGSETYLDLSTRTTFPNKFAFTQGDTDYYTTTNRRFTGLDSIFNHSQIITDSESGTTRYRLELDVLAQTDPGTIIATVISPRRNSIIFKPQLSSDLEEFFSELGFSYAMITSEYRSATDGKIATNYELVACQRDINVTVDATTTGSTYVSMRSSGIQITLTGFHNDEDNLETITVDNTYNCLNSDYRLIAIEFYGRRSVSDRYKEYIKTTDFSECSETSFNICDDVLEKLKQSYAQYESTPLPSTVLNDLRKIPADVLAEAQKNQ